MHRAGFVAVLIVGISGATNSQIQPAANPAQVGQRKEPSDPADKSLPPDSQSLQIIDKVQPVYPIEAAEKKLQGQAVLKVLISETGTVENPEVVTGDELLAQAAVGAVKSWKFHPYISGGKPTKVSATIPFDFIFRDTPPDDADPSPEAGPASGQRVVWVSGESLAKLIIKKELQRPEYPAIAKVARVQGNVRLRAVIGTDGAVRYLRVLSGPPLLNQSALDAVTHWRYRPYVLNGQPVEVQTIITVMYTLSNF